MRGKGLFFVVSLLAAVALLGCAPTPAVPPASAGQPAAQSSGGGTAPSTASAPSAGAAAAPASAPGSTAASAPASARNILKIAISQEPDVLYLTTGMYYSGFVQTMIYDRLVNYDDKAEMIPGMAESVPTLENGGAKFVAENGEEKLQVTYKIRPGIKWHDGTPFTSADVKWTWETIMDPKTTQVSRVVEEKIERIDTPDDLTAIVTFKGGVKEPRYNRVPNWIYPKHYLGKLGADGIIKSEEIRKPVGTGPYMLKEWEAGSSITLEANPDYYGGAPKIKTVVIRIIPDTNTLLAAFKSGEVDFIESDVEKTPELEELASAGKAVVTYNESTTVEYWGFNLTHPALGDKRVRQAIAYALDRNLMVETILYGKTKVAASYVPATAWMYNSALEPYPVDPAKARQLLDEAGWAPGPDGIRVKDGKKLTIKLNTTAANKMREKVSQIAQDNLKAVGIDLQFDFQPASVFFGPENKGLEGSFDVREWATLQDPLDMTLNANAVFRSDRIPTKENNYSGGNYWRYQNPELDKIVRDASNQLVRAEAKPLLDKWQQINHDDVVILPPFARPNVSVATPSLKNARATSYWLYPTWNIKDWYFEK